MLIPAADFVPVDAFPGCFGGVIAGPAFLGTAATAATTCITGGPVEAATAATPAVPGILFLSSHPKAVSVNRINDQFHSFVSGILQLMLRHRLII